MPIIVKDFSWWQTDCKLFIQIQIPHISQKNADILTSSKYLKVSATPVFIWYQIKSWVITQRILVLLLQVYNINIITLLNIKYIIEIAEKYNSN